MGWLFGRHRKSQAEKTLEALQQQAGDGGFATAQTSPMPPTAAQPDATDFAMRIDNKFTITGRGLVLTGRIDNGSVRTGQQVRVISRQHGPTQPHEVVGIESFRKMRDSAQAGDEIGLLLRGLSPDDVDAGDQIVG